MFGDIAIRSADGHRWLVWCYSVMTDSKNWLVVLIFLLMSALKGLAFTASDADTIFSAYNTAYYVNVGGSAYYRINNGTGTSPGWWTFAEEIEMAEDAYVN